MAVLAEAISVIVKRASIEARYPGGWDAFVQNAPNRTLCADKAVVRLGFMTPADVEAFVKELEQKGLGYLVTGKARDLVVADQQRGFLVQCDWAELGHIKLEGDEKRQVAACRAKAAWDDMLITPPGWTYEGSLSQQHSFVPSGQVGKKLKLLRSENGQDVYLDAGTGKEVYVARTARQETRPQNAE